MKTYNTFLPVFNGFYNSIFEADGEDEEIQHINEEREKIDLEPIEYDDCKWDYKEYNLRVSEKCVEVIEEELNDLLNIDIKVTFESLQSPKYYNCSTDSINVEIEVENLDVILAYLEKEKENFAEYIKERYSSYDGFMSFMSNDSDVWVEDINNGEHIITTYYQDRCDSEDEYIWEKLSEGKVYCKDWEGEDKITDEMLEDAVQWLYMGGNTEIIKVPLIKN